MKQYPISKAILPSGETIAYRDTGRGPMPDDTAIVLVHGNMSSSVHWQSTMEALEQTSRVIAPDLRGFGDSGYCSRFDSLGELAEDVDALLSLLGIEKYILAGWSAGGGVAMELAIATPHRVKKLLLINPVPHTGYPIYRKDETGKPIPSELLKSKEEIAGDPVQVLPVLAAIDAGNRDMLRFICDATLYNLHQPSPEEYDAFLRAMLQQRCLVDLDYALLTFNISHRHNGVVAGNGRLDEIKAPVHILQGGKDLVVPAGWIEQMVEDFPAGTERITFAKAGHSLMTDDYDLFIHTMKWLAG